jgi:hypothetical protein
MRLLADQQLEACQNRLDFINQGSEAEPSNKSLAPP